MAEKNLTSDTTLGGERENSSRDRRRRLFSFPLETGKVISTVVPLVLPEGEPEDIAVREGYFPGVCGEIQDFIFSQSSYPSLILSGGASIGVVGSLIYGEIAGPTGAFGTSTHTYNAFIGVTGFGKQFIIRGIKACLRASPAIARLIGPDGFVRAGSGNLDRTISGVSA